MQLQRIKAVPDLTSVITFTAQLDEQSAQRRISGVSGRLLTFLQSMQQFSTIVDTFVSSNPGTAALVWGSVKLTMLVGQVSNGVHIRYIILSRILDCK
jgi:hypothetical protein